MNNLTKLERLYASCESCGDACRMDTLSRCVKCHRLVCGGCSRKQDSGTGRVCKGCNVGG